MHIYWIIIALTYTTSFLSTLQFQLKYAYFIYFDLWPLSLMRLFLNLSLVCYYLFKISRLICQNTTKDNGFSSPRYYNSQKFILNSPSEIVSSKHSIIHSLLSLYQVLTVWCSFPYSIAHAVPCLAAWSSTCLCGIVSELSELYFYPHPTPNPWLCSVYHFLSML